MYRCNSASHSPKVSYKEIWGTSFKYVTCDKCGETLSIKRLDENNDDFSNGEVLTLIIGVIIIFTFVVYLIPGMFGAPLKAVSGFLPSESSFNLIEIISQNLI